MFESPASTARPVFRIDPWAVDYGSSFDADAESEEESGESADPFVETADWSQGRTAVETSRPPRVVFVDGVQRVEVWGRIQQDDRLVEAALASVAVGASICSDNSARIDHLTPSRLLAASSSLSADAFDVQAGAVSLRFEAESSQRSGREGVYDAIRNRRAELERRLAESLIDRDSLVVLDGRLSFDPSRATPVVGFAKTIQRFYLPEPQRRLVFHLRERERTPVFRITYGETSRYSWFLRLPYTRAIHHSLAGVVRLETPEIGAEAAIQLANLTAYHLPAFASKPQHDPRAPQNLLPVGGLERRLRHELGDPAFIRRAIEDHLSREAANE